MKTIRLGNDINVSWIITRNGEAEDFSSKDVKVYLYDKYNVEQKFEYTIEGNIINGTFYGKDQSTNGVYRLCLVENDGQVNMATVDYIDCWLLSNKLKNQTSNGEDSKTEIIRTETVDLSSTINTNGNVNLTDYYTKSEVDQKIADVASGCEIDLSAYAKTDNVYSKVQSDAKYQPKGEYLTEHQSLEDYYTKNEIDGKNYLTGIDAQATLYSKDEINTKLADYAKSNSVYTKTEIDEKGYLTSHQDLSDYAKKSEIPSTENIYTKDEIDNFNFINAYNLSQMVYSKEESDAKYLTEHQSLSNYYNKSEIDNKIARINDVPTKTSQLTNDSGFLTETDVYTKTQTYSKTEVDSLVANSSSSGGGGFNVVTNSSDSTKKGLVNSLSEYYDTNIGNGAVIEGKGYDDINTIVASGAFSHAEGSGTAARGNQSHAEGYYTTANGVYSHAEGNGTHANGNCSHASGYNTTAQNTYEAAFGIYNTSRVTNDNFGSKNKTLYSIGNGNPDAIPQMGQNDDNAHHNAFEIRQNGDIYIADTSFLKEGNKNYNSNFKYHTVPYICLQDKFDTMLTSSNVSAVAISGDYTDLNNRPFGDFIEQLEETIYTYEGTTSQNGPTHFGVVNVSIDTSNLSAGDEVILKVDDSVYGKGIVYEESTNVYWINQDPTKGSPFNDTWSVYSGNGESYSISINILSGTQHKIELVKNVGEQLVTRQIDSKYVDAYTKSEIDAKITDIASTYATKAEVPQIWIGTQEQYDAITTKSETTIYIIK